MKVQGEISFEDLSKVLIQRRCNILIKWNGGHHAMITNVFYVPEDQYIESWTTLGERLSYATHDSRYSSKANYSSKDDKEQVALGVKYSMLKYLSIINDKD